jgi:uncharacterized protein YdeI (YjbR/CyaY-like superfamily)
MSKKTKSKPASKSFKTTLERLPSNLGWTIIRIPFNVHKVWGTPGRLRVKGEINGFAFRTCLFPTRTGQHFLLVNKKMQNGAQAFAGSPAQCLLEPDTAERLAVIPSELKRALAEDRSLRAWFDELSYSIRKWICDWVAQPKSAASRTRRAEQIAEQVLSVMEAEHQLPPALRLAFMRDPRALAGWKQMSRTRRRHQLLSIFHYRTPDARARRVDRAVEEAIAFAQKKSRGSVPES